MDSSAAWSKPNNCFQRQFLYTLRIDKSIDSSVSLSEILYQKYVRECQIYVINTCIPELCQKNVRSISGVCQRIHVYVRSMLEVCNIIESEEFQSYVGSMSEVCQKFAKVCSVVSTMSQF